MSGESALFLELEALQDEVLRQATALDERLESLLAEYARSRNGDRAASSDAAETGPETEAAAPSRPAARPAPFQPKSRAA